MQKKGLQAIVTHEAEMEAPNHMVSMPDTPAPSLLWGLAERV